VSTVGIQPYLAPDDPAGPTVFAGVVRSLAPKIVAEGIATEHEIGLDTLAQRLSDAIHAANAVLLPPDVVGAWGYAG
jgi:hypothetical protein